MQIFKNPNYDFVKYRWPALILSFVVVLAGVAAIFVRGLPLGVEFSGGTIVVVEFDQLPGIDDVRGAVGRTFGGGENLVVQHYGPEADHRIMVRVPDVGREAGAELSRPAEQIEAALREADLGTFRVVSSEIVGPIVGQDLTRKGLLAFSLSLFFILLYLWFRFELSFAVGATLATAHDVLVTLAFLVFFQFDISLNVIAALLTITGYSTNDTIVIFDRVRENLRSTRRENIVPLVNSSLNQTLNRTVITGGTALLAVTALYFFGGEVLKGFAFTMIVGMLAGTYSSIYIAAAIVTFWPHGKGGSRVSAGAPAGPARSTTTARQRKTGRSVRAS
ncbi:MAG TPA: protein translocase subunit SecF [Vicinamibacterales bacterium]|nr:protein translocase subunit SecF [Vicinamibacterales bacterium]